MATIFDTAKYILGKRQNPSFYELQKLCYYCKAWSLALGEGSLFPENFEAWPHGPVCPILFKQHQGSFTVTDGMITKGSKDNISPNQSDVIDSVLQFYHGLDGDALESRTHEELPWIKARNGLPLREPCNNLINEDDMRSFYKGSQDFEKMDDIFLFTRASRRLHSNKKTFSFEEIMNMSGISLEDVINAEDVEIE